MIGTILLCIIIADFLTGFFHWIEDTYGVPTWFFIGEPVILPNIDHHRNPTRFTMGSFFNRNIQPAIGLCVVLGALWFLGWASWPVALTVFITAWGNEVHSWAHRKKNGPIVNFLQDAGLVQSKSQHAKHHRPPYNKYFCTLTNFVNPVLEVIRFWQTAEWLLAKVGIEPKRMSPERDGY